MSDIEKIELCAQRIKDLHAAMTDHVISLVRVAKGDILYMEMLVAMGNTFLSIADGLFRQIDTLDTFEPNKQSVLNIVALMRESLERTIPSSEAMAEALNKPMNGKVH